MTGNGNENGDEDDAERQPGPPTVVRSTGPDESVSTTVINAVAAAKGREPAELAPLGDVVDTHALDRLFSPLRDPVAGPRMGTIEFRYEGYLVSVDAAGRVTVRTNGDGETGE